MQDDAFAGQHFGAQSLTVKSTEGIAVVGKNRWKIAGMSRVRAVSGIEMPACCSECDAFQGSAAALLMKVQAEYVRSADICIVRQPPKFMRNQQPRRAEVKFHFAPQARIILRAAQQCAGIGRGGKIPGFLRFI